MREESHLDAMRDAIRGDFERLRERRGDQVVLRMREGPETTERMTVEPGAAETEDVRPRRSWIDRLLGL